MTTILLLKSQIRPPWQGEGPLRDSRTAFGFDLELLLLPGKMETVQFTTYAKEVYYFNGDNSVSKSQFWPPWQGEGPLRDSRSAFGFDLEVISIARENGDGPIHHLR